MRQRFGRLVLQAADDLYAVDRCALLEASNAFLDVGGDDNSIGLVLARGMAFRAAEWCVWDTLETYVELLKAVNGFKSTWTIKDFWLEPPLDLVIVSLAALLAAPAARKSRRTR